MNDQTTPDLIKLATDVADYIAGTSYSLQNVLETFGAAGMDDNETFCYELDQRVFECEACGWWCEMSAMSEKEQVCEECFNE